MIQVVPTKRQDLRNQVEVGSFNGVPVKELAPGVYRTDDMLGIDAYFNPKVRVLIFGVAQAPPSLLVDGLAQRMWNHGSRELESLSERELAKLQRKDLDKPVLDLKISSIDPAAFRSPMRHHFKLANEEEYRPVTASILGMWRSFRQMFAPLGPEMLVRIESDNWRGIPQSCHSDYFRGYINLSGRGTHIERDGFSYDLAPGEGALLKDAWHRGPSLATDKSEMRALCLVGFPRVSLSKFESFLAASEQEEIASTLLKLAKTAAPKA